MSSELLCNPLLYLEIMKRKHPEIFAEWCCNELSHVLDFSGPENLGQVLMGNIDLRHGKPITKKFSKRRKNNDETVSGIFGSPLNDAGFCYARQLIEHLKKAVNHEGIFRIPGNSGRQQRLKDRIDTKAIIDLDNNEFTTNDIACVLKTFLGDLPEPLLTDRQYHAFIEASGLTHQIDAANDMSPGARKKLKVLRRANHIKALRYLAFLLPPLNLKLLKELMELLNDVADNHETNKMSVHNLGVIFAPHVVWPRYLTTEDLKDQSLVRKINYGMEFMIRHFNQIFIAPSSLLKKCEMYVKMGGLVPEESPHRRPQRPLRPADDSDCSRVSRPQRASVKVPGQRNHTEAALAQLYADVRAMPEGPKKRKLMKQFAESSFLPGTPTQVQDDLARLSSKPRRQRSKSVGEAILKQVSTPFHHKKRRVAPPPPDDGGQAKQNFQVEKNLCRELMSQLVGGPKPKKSSNQENRQPRSNSQDSPTTACNNAINQLYKVQVPSPISSSPGPRGSPLRISKKGKSYGKRPVPVPRHTSSPIEGHSVKRDNDGYPVPSPRKTPLVDKNRPSPQPRPRRAWSQETPPMKLQCHQTHV